MKRTTLSVLTVGFQVNSSSAKHSNVCIHVSADQKIKLNKDLEALGMKAKAEMIRCFQNKYEVEENSSPKGAMKFLSDLF